jgi:hypothetical protein
MTTTGKNRNMIYGPKTDGTYVVEFRTAEGESLAISIPRTETAVIRHFQERMPYGLFVPDGTPFDKRSREAVLMGFGLTTAKADALSPAGSRFEGSRKRGGGC